MHSNLLEDIETLSAQLKLVRLEAIQAAKRFSTELQEVHRDQAASALNLVHYIGLRQYDLQNLQMDLGRLGLGSLGRLECHVMATLDAMLSILHKLGDLPWTGRNLEDVLPDLEQGVSLLPQRTTLAIGPAPTHRQVRFMVSASMEMAQSPHSLRELLEQGMNLLQILGAEGTVEQWHALSERLLEAQQDSESNCRLAFELSGQDLRTGSIDPSPGIIRWKPRRNPLGQVIEPAVVTFCPSSSASDVAGVIIPIKGPLQHLARRGDIILLTDTRGRERKLHVIDLDESSCVCTCEHTGYVVQGIALKLFRNEQLICEDAVGSLPMVEFAIPLSVGDELIMTPAAIPGRPATGYQGDSDYLPAQIGCNQLAIFTDAKPGDRVVFDHGKLVGTIQSHFDEGSSPRLSLKITHSAQGTTKLRAGKPIHLPDTVLQTKAVQERTLEQIQFACTHADLLVLTPVRSLADVKELIAAVEHTVHLDAAPSIALKIDNSFSVQQLPLILLAAMRLPRLALYLSRADLAVEFGPERLPRILEEIQCLCEAAHLPVIWSTQELNALTKRGQPAPSEMVVSFIPQNAAAVLLSKGPQPLLALEFLTSVTESVKAPTARKYASMRKLDLAELAMR